MDWYNAYTYNEATEEEKRIPVAQLKKLGRDYGDPEAYGYGEYWTDSYLMAVKSKDPAEVAEALNRVFNRRCHCAHDCCGHVSASVWRIKHTKRREYLVQVTCHVVC